MFVFPDWNQGVGYVTADMISDHIPISGADSIVLMCGPAPMLQHACIPSLDELGYPTKQRFTY